jgi:hypothetical protein
MPFKQIDITRAIKGARAAGLEVREVIASEDGIRVICDDGEHQPITNSMDKRLGL